MESMEEFWHFESLWRILDMDRLCYQWARQKQIDEVVSGQPVCAEFVEKGCIARFGREGAW
jgi:hypothetical protein